jgi:transcriptional regulator with XRE-family HTH domain
MKHRIAYQTVVGIVLASHRKAANIGQRGLAARMEMCQSTLSKLERGAMPMTVECLAKYSGLLGTTPSQILTDVDMVIPALARDGIQVLPKLCPDDEIVSARILRPLVVRAMPEQAKRI